MFLCGILVRASFKYAYITVDILILHEHSELDAVSPEGAQLKESVSRCSVSAEARLRTQLDRKGFIRRLNTF